MTPDQVAALFTRADGSYLFARWGRPVVPVVFGVEADTLAVVKGALEAVVALAGQRIGEVDTELGANLMLFFLREWDELAQTPNLDRLLPDLGPLVARLQAAQANQYRVFRFDAAGSIRAAFVFVRMDAAMTAIPAEALALAQAVQVILLWSDVAFAGSSPLGLLEGVAVVRPDVAAVIRAGYDPALPDVSRDPAHAYRLAARIG